MIHIEKTDKGMKVLANGTGNDIFDEYAAGIASMIVQLEAMSGGRLPRRRHYTT